MGDIGEYWNEHRQYKRDKQRADRLGISVQALWKKDESAARLKAESERAERLAGHAIQCEYGRSFLNVNSHNQHKTVYGKKGYKGAAVNHAGPTRESDTTA